MKMLSVEEAATRLAALVEDACRGEEVVLTSGGMPVARLTPAAGAASGAEIPDARPSATEREKAWQAARTLMEQGLPFGGVRWTRDELYDDPATDDRTDDRRD